MCPVRGRLWVKAERKFWASPTDLPPRTSRAVARLKCPLYFPAASLYNRTNGMIAHERI